MASEEFQLWKSLKENEAYLLSLEFGEIVWGITKEWDWFTKQTIGVQYVSSTDSVSTNIAEGWGKFSYKDKNKYFRIARGSLMESMNWTVKAYKRGLIPEDKFQRLKQIFDTLPHEINKLMYYNKTKMEK
ncbi:MAG: hypothetical protein A3C90_00785 [Candidatus Magasanikbacteria bacterium RIFCSPHIGHO2_02_FULL_51_14]|uniref:Four helix bundle protein n=1 Tax=Candidatus Magasanikbacteria bacterium RIFCSPHIGHO2_02_FULL_51_14 TaxID=1798683 RepID=A0A1F6MQ88_9BACT|nr:MAG: hypothetical protein A3C90_00785 [Candidatus Magasanikbacteria bacterium RIFCSPHIGHO2_02_FULL_51_14]